MDIDLKALRELALAATPGEWQAVLDSPDFPRVESDGHWIAKEGLNMQDAMKLRPADDPASVYWPKVVHELNVANMRYIAAVGPQTVLALLDMLEGGKSRQKRTSGEPAASTVRATKLRKERESKGLCVRCGQAKPVEGKKQCKACMDKARLNVAKCRARKKGEDIVGKIATKYQQFGNDMAALLSIQREPDHEIDGFTQELLPGLYDYGFESKEEGNA